MTTTRTRKTVAGGAAAVVAAVAVTLAATGSDPSRSTLNLNPGGSAKVTCSGSGSTLGWSKENAISGTATCTGSTTTTTAAATTTTAPITVSTTAAPPTTVPPPSPTTLPPVTTTTAPGPAGAMPTASNTGPTSAPTSSVPADSVASARGVAGKVVTGGVSAYVGLGETWTFSDCVIKGSLSFLVDGGSASYALSQYPTVNISRCRIEGSFVFVGAAKVTMDDVYVTNGAGMIAPCGDCAGLAYGTVREMPWVVKNSLFTSPPGDPNDGYHYEGAHIAGTGQGYVFTNTRFVQEGPVNGTQTGALFFHGGRSTFDGCYFDDGDQGVSNAYYYTVYAYGTGPGAGQNVVKNSSIERGIATYVYPNTAADPVIHATYTGNRDFHTGGALTLP